MVEITLIDHITFHFDPQAINRASIPQETLAIQNVGCLNVSDCGVAQYNSNLAKIDSK